MADNFDEFDDDRDEVEAAEEDALYLAEEVNTDDEGDDDAELASASSTLDEEEDVEDADEDGNEPGFISEEERARSLMVDMPNPHGSIIEGANGGEGTIVRAAFLGKEMQTSFLEYSMSVIVSRALPDVRDGLKPVHRRILYAMNESGYTPNKPHMKSARTVGDVIGNTIPMATSPCTTPWCAWPSLQPAPAPHRRSRQLWLHRRRRCRCHALHRGAPRQAGYGTSARPGQGDRRLQPNYDESLQEPTVLPSRFPNLLVNGSAGIAVGMATNIPPHNLGEAIDATCLMIDNPDCTTEDLLTAMPGPDFPTGGLIMGRRAFWMPTRPATATLPSARNARSRRKKNGRASIVVKEIPYQVNRKRLLEKLGELVRDKKTALRSAQSTTPPTARASISSST